VKPDVIYLNSLFSFTFTLQPLWLKKKFPEIRFILAPRGMLGKGALELKKKKKEVFIGLARLIKLYDRIIWHATNEKEKKEISKAFGLQDNIMIADNMATNPKFTFSEIEKMKMENFESKRFLFVSRVARVKNVEKLVEWFLKIAKDSNFQLDILGSNEDKEYFQEIVEIIAEHNNISLIGAIHPDDIAEYYAKAHFFCLPTRHENYGHVIIEALSYACPIIISNRTPWRKLEDKNIGWDLPLEKPKRFLEVMEECVEMDKEKYMEMSKSAFDYAQKHINRSNLKDAYRKLLT
jgi:glycosyltransferase involved in cell wall biosynthesis